MFETSVVRVRAAAAPRRVGLLTASIAFHSLVVVAAIAVTVSSVELPKKAPNMMEPFRVVAPPTLPPALGTPHPPAPRPAAQPQAPARPTQTAAAITAPQVVPDTITPAASSAPAADASATGSATGTGEGPIGLPDGVPGGIGVGTGGGDAVPDAIMHPGGEVKPPVVLHRVDPVYPPLAVKAHLNGTVVVECIIGRNGICRDPKVMMSTSPIFERSAIDAVQQWRFVPGIYRDQPVDTYFDLTIKFQLN